MSEVGHICLFFVNINNNNKESNTFFKSIFYHLFESN